ncbi:hypothetical protein SH580_09600 [Coraliomargarita algicola]|uniref:FecR protein domain-containing protein n=1 Tax=Coraliomargarita algicola TaxID=3092156 RepID=A0ABZ0RS10_9BACT|nr:hypothetical protein [Coraliomargarita sp. J2-16]WPJ97963.1 hypothetical protein SH580_09600 [Coraliomargarita sp. J2-16]
MTHFIKVLAVVLLPLASPLGAETWVSGAITLHQVSGEVALKKLGGAPVMLTAEQVPVSEPGLIDCEAAYGSAAYLSTSNRTRIYFQGEGSFSIERFEQMMPNVDIWESAETETGQSRMIVNFRSGDIIVDNRNMLEASQCLIETPLGRLTVKRALWQMRIEFDPRSQIFDFTINCSDGRVRFTDLQGQQYTLRAGQRLAGAGARATPSIEIGERTDRSLEQIQRFKVILDQHAKAVNDLAQYLDHLQSIDQAARQSAAVPARRKTEMTRRPIVIEYADEPAPVTPFRGELKPPSAYQADLF